MTLRRRLTAAFVVVVTLPLLVGALLLSRTLPEQARQSQQRSLQVAAHASAQVLLAQCELLRATAEAAARVTAAAVAARRPPPSAELLALVARGPAAGVSVRDTTGRQVAGAGPVPAGAVDCGGSAAGRARALSAVVPLRTPGGAAAGQAVATRPLTGPLLAQLATAGEVALLAQDGTLAAGGPVPGQILRAAARAAGPGGAGRVAGRVWAVQPGPGLWVLLLQRPDPGPDLLLGTGVVLLVSVLVAVGLAVLSARATTRPLAELSAAAALIADGDLSTVIAVRSRDEVGGLASSFNAMTSALQDSIGALRASHEELRAGLARLGDTLSSTHDLDRILVVVLEAAAAAVGAGSGRVLLLSPDRRELVLAASTGERRRQTWLPRQPVDEGAVGRVALTGDPEEVDGAVLVVPLVSSGTIIGVVELLAAPASPPFQDGDLATVRTFAGQAAVAVDNVLLHQEAQRLSLTDGLTGLWNFRYFTMTVGKEIERATRFGRPLALLMLDLDHFKVVNDTWGHQCGDAVLVELAARVRGQVRDVDTVARYGGEELVVVLPETDEDGAMHLAERICAAVRGADFGGVRGPVVAVSVSVGVAVFPQHGSSSALLLAAADRALYVAKAEGRDTWRLALPDLPTPQRAGGSVH